MFMAEKWICSWCNKEIEPQTLSSDVRSRKKRQLKEYGRVYCSKECGKAAGRKFSGEFLKEYNRLYASERMKKNNPSKQAHVRDKISQTLKAIGHKPKYRYGNGSGLTESQKLMMKLLQEFEPISEYAIPTNKPREANGYPTCYKVDIGIPQFKVAVELDGGSHCLLKRQAEDKKKDELLVSLGWSVLRFWNKQAIENSDECIKLIISTIKRIKYTKEQ